MIGWVHRHADLGRPGLVPVTWHDQRGTPIYLHPIADRHGDECCPEHPADVAAKERLPKHRPTDRDYFAEARRG